MESRPISQRARNIMNAGSTQLVFDYFVNVYLQSQQESKEIADFTFGNPHEMPIEGLVNTYQKWIIPQNKDWFAYKLSEPHAQAVVAKSLQRQFGMPFEPKDIAMTTGGFAAIMCAIKTVGDPGDEVIFNLPPWFNYEPLIIEAGLTPVKVTIDLETFDLDLDAIASAITQRTRVVIVNSPHNPTGKVIPPETLSRLAEILDKASERIGRRIYLLSDEAYNRIVFDGVEYRSPVEFYPYSFFAYSYGKTLLAPGQRIGYLALPPTMPREDRELSRSAILAIQSSSGFVFPNALLQHGIEDLEQLSLDVEHLQHKRDHMVAALSEMGYQLHVPEGTFYLFPRSPIPDDRAFAELLMQHNVAVLPGALFETPGYYRICLTANDEMIERGLPGFLAAIKAVKGQRSDVTN